MRLLACALAALVAVLGLPAAAIAEGRYAPPVDGPVLDPFRRPPTAYAAGNRGIDFATRPGDPVRAAADGVVVFAGQVGTSRHVVVLHDDGIRTSYSFLASVGVRRGDTVRRGDPVGTAGASVHFGARAGDDRYLDPAALLEGRPPAIRLVPVEQRRAEPEGRERLALVRSLVSHAVRAGGSGVAWARDTAVDAVGLGVDMARSQVSSVLDVLSVVRHLYDVQARFTELAQRGLLVWRSQGGCTPASTPPAPPPPGRRLAVLVGGFGSSAGRAAVLDVDTAALGYAPGDVAQFSYRGGQATPGIDGVPVRGYGASDTQVDIRASGARLRELLGALRMRYPGVPVDLIAHSQGGLVVRAALGEDTDRIDARLPTVANVITLGTPNQGTEVALAAKALGTSALGASGEAVLRGITSDGLDGLAPSVRQMSPDSGFVADLADRGLPGVRVTAIGARGDLVVPALSATLPGATNVVVRLDGPNAHDRLPGSPEAQREMRLALAGQGPTCRNVVGDVVAGAGVALAEDIAAGAAAWLSLRSMAARPG